MRRPSSDHRNLFKANPTKVLVLSSGSRKPSDPVSGSSIETARFHRSTVPLLDADAKTEGFPGLLCGKQIVVQHCCINQVIFFLLRFLTPGQLRPFAKLNEMRDLPLHVAHIIIGRAREANQGAITICWCPQFRCPINPGREYQALSTSQKSFGHGTTLRRRCWYRC